MISDRRFQSPRLQPEKERSIPINKYLRMIMMLHLHKPHLAHGNIVPV